MATYGVFPFSRIGEGSLRGNRAPCLATSCIFSILIEISCCLAFSSCSPISSWSDILSRSTGRGSSSKDNRCRGKGSSFTTSGSRPTRSCYSGFSWLSKSIRASHWSIPPRDHHSFIDASPTSVWTRGRSCCSRAITRWRSRSISRSISSSTSKIYIYQYI